MDERADGASSRVCGLVLSFGFACRGMLSKEERESFSWGRRESFEFGLERLRERERRLGATGWKRDAL